MLALFEPEANLAYAPWMDSSRKTNAQDCAKPVVVDQGNLRCR
jgi:hypothetical protein